MSTVHYLNGELLPSVSTQNDEMNNLFILSNLKNLMNKVSSLEGQINKAVTALKSKESFNMALAEDLDHIMTIFLNKMGSDKKPRIEPIF